MLGSFSMTYPQSDDDMLNAQLIILFYHSTSAFNATGHGNRSSAQSASSSPCNVQCAQTLILHRLKGSHSHMPDPLSRGNSPRAKLSPPHFLSDPRLQPMNCTIIKDCTYSRITITSKICPLPKIGLSTP